MATQTRVIGVWYDETSGADRPAWIVSLDDLDESGGALSTRTLDVLDTRAEAIDSAREESKKHGLPIRAE